MRARNVSDSPSLGAIASACENSRRASSHERAHTRPRLEIKEGDEGIWIVGLLSDDLGFFDLEQKTLQPFDNPFGPSLSRMSSDWTNSALAETVSATIDSKLVQARFTSICFDLVYGLIVVQSRLLLSY